MRYLQVMMIVLVCTGCTRLTDAMIRHREQSEFKHALRQISADEELQRRLKRETFVTQQAKAPRDVVDADKYPNATQQVSLNPAKEFDKSKQDALDVRVLPTTEINQGILVLVDKSIPEESFLVQMDKDVLCIRIGVKHHLATLFSDEFFLGVRKGVSVPKKE